MEKHSVTKERARFTPRLAVMCLLILVLVLVIMGLSTRHQEPQQPQQLDSPTANTSLKAISNGNTNPTPTFAHPPTVVANYPGAQAISQPSLDYADSFWATVVAIKQTLPTASPIPGLPLDKAIGFQETDLERRASGTALALYPPPTAFYFPTLVPDNWPTPAPNRRPAGAGTISDDMGGPALARQLLIANLWWETIGRQDLIVAAGSEFKRFDPLQGEILIAIQDDTNYSIVGNPILYLTPSRHGIVRVIDAVGERLTLRGEDGTLFYFDVPTRQWTNP